MAQRIAEIHLCFDRARIYRQGLADDGECFGRTALAKKDVTEQVQGIEFLRFRLQNLAIECGRVGEPPALMELHCLVEQLAGGFRDRGPQAKLPSCNDAACRAVDSRQVSEE